MELPVTRTLTGRRPTRAAAPNPHGYTPVDGYTEYDIPVHGMAPGPSSEALAAGRDPASVTWTLYCPAGVEVRASDQVDIDGVLHDVVGHSLDWTQGPWPHPTAGVVVELKRQEG